MLKYINVKLSVTIIKLASSLAEVAGTLVGCSNSQVLILWCRDPPLETTLPKRGKPLHMNFSTSTCRLKQTKHEFYRAKPFLKYGYSLMLLQDIKKHNKVQV